jgi:hypothetical protein
MKRRWTFLSTGVAGAVEAAAQATVPFDALAEIPFTGGPVLSPDGKRIAAR